MFGNDRAQLREFYHTVWTKHSQGLVLEPLEGLVAQVIELHPEYMQVLSDAGAISDEFDGPNPYLHMGMHVALREQLQSGRPNGIRALYRRITKRFSDLHQGEHAMMVCLRDVMLEAQARGAVPDDTSEANYLAALHELTGRSKR
jgi:hypothetical protein